jgi:uncharacterized protein (DUF2141 family)
MKALVLITALFLANSTFASATISITGINNNRGVVQLAVWSSQAGFPEDYQKAILLKTIALDEVNAVELSELEPGTYAIAIYHDENEDVVLNRNIFGIPKEGFGFSRNPKIRFGPPKFDEASVQVSDDSSLTIKINYP